ncbi:MAG: hypothetical protein KatS3mg015_2486 [Fimbriimonadales bacterium]|nr:MAG: hypothetical protein KatS3mg015_2486 [Fimbriimonadales bacterium]
MAKSQYLESYLEENRRRGWGCGLTIGTYLAYTLRGRAKHYAAGYQRALERAVISAGAIRGWSAGRSVAWYPRDVLNGVPEPPRPSHRLALAERARLASETLRGQRRGEFGPIQVPIDEFGSIQVLSDAFGGDGPTRGVMIGIDLDPGWLAEQWEVPVRALELAWETGCAIIDDLRMDEHGRLHGVDEPALVLRAGTWYRPTSWRLRGLVTSRQGRGEIRAWHGTLLSRTDIALVHDLTAAEIALGPEALSGASSIEARRAVIEMRIGNGGMPTDKEIIAALSAQVLDAAPEHRATLITDPHESRLLLLRCHSTDRPYIVRVPPTMRRTREALAWTFGVEEQEYAPLVES